MNERILTIWLHIYHEQRVTDPDTDHGRCEGAHAPAAQHPQHGTCSTAAPAGATVGDAAGTAAGAAAAPAPAPAPPPPAPQVLLQWGSPPRKEGIRINTEPSPLKEVLEGWVTTAPWWRGATPMLQNPICRICWVLQPPQTPPPPIGEHHDGGYLGATSWVFSRPRAVLVCWSTPTQVELLMSTSQVFFYRLF
eukprot:COSAG01_NODE_147_length_24095_cov_25.855428_4_plen_193_part_00